MLEAEGRLLEMARLRRPADTAWRLSGGSIAPLDETASSEAAAGATSADSERDSTIWDIVERGGVAEGDRSVDR